MTTFDETKSQIKAVFFDFMGTCLDWCSSVANGLPEEVSLRERRAIALIWRVFYFQENEKNLKAGKPVENIDETLHRTIDQFLTKGALSKIDPSMIEKVKKITGLTASSSSSSDELIKAETLSYIKECFEKEPKRKEDAIAAWHQQSAWPEVKVALETIRNEMKKEIFVHANGTTRLQLDLIRSSGLQFDLAMSSQMLGKLKPDPEPYLKGLRLVDCQANQCVLVAAHASDLRGGKNVGMKTIYIHRETDDIHEELSKIENEFDLVLWDMKELPNAIKRL